MTSTRFRHYNLFKLLLLLCLLSWTGTTATAAVLSGMVTKDGVPTGGLCVDIRADRDACGNNLLASATTISDGSFTVNVDNNQNYYIVTNANCEGFHPLVMNKFWDGLGNSGQYSCNSAELLEVADSDITGINFALETGVGVTGLIKDAGDTPLAEVCVNFNRGDNACNNDWVAGGTTNTSGIYTALVPKNSQYYVNTQANCQGSNPTIINKYWNGLGNPSVLSCDQVTQQLSVNTDPVTTVDLTLEAGEIISGNVRDMADAPIENVCVNFFTGSNGCDSQWMGGGTTDTNGNYSAVVPSGQGYYARTHATCRGVNQMLIDKSWDGSGPENHGTLDCNNALLTPEPPATDINFQLEKGGRITGNVTDENGPIDGEQQGLDVQALTGDACENNEHINGTNVNSDGSFSLLVPLTGQYLLRITSYNNDSPYLEKWFSGFDGENPTSSTNCQDAALIGFSEGEELIDRADFVLEKGGRITGTVFEGNVPIDGEQYDIGVNAYSGDACNDHQHVTGSNLDSEGSYGLTLPLDGQYLLGIYSNDSPYLEEWFSGFDDEGNPTSSQNCQDAVALGFVGDVELIEHADFTLEKGGKITGTVSDTNGPINGNDYNMGVAVFAGDPCGNYQFIRSHGLDENGTYSVTLPTQGQYLVRIYNDNSPYAEKWFAGFNDLDQPVTSYNCGEAAQLSFSEGQDLIQNVNFDVEKGGKVSGFVYESDGSTPLSGEPNDIRVDAYLGTPCDHTFIGGGNVYMADGSYITSTLPPGNVFLKVNHTQLHSSPWWKDTPPGITENCEEASAITITPEMTTTGKNFSLPKDSDGDGLTDDDEAIYGTDPFKRDTDGDGIPDDGEVYLWGEDFGGNIDNDGFTNINDTDADNDGVSDLQELARGGDMRDPAAIPPALTLYDDFSSGALSSEKWAPEEYQMITKDGALQFFINSPSIYRQRALTPATNVQNIKASVTITDLATNTGGSVYFNLHGVYYHEDTDSNPQTGRVYASMSLYDSGAGLQAMYSIGRIINESGETATVKSAAIATQAGLTTGTPYKMEIKYNGTNGFTFNLYDGGDVLLGTATDTGNAFGAPLTDSRGLQVLTLDKGGKIGAAVASFETGNGTEPYTEYDSFASTASSPLDPSLWVTPEIMKRVSGDNKLHLISHSFENRLSNRAYLKHRFDYIESRVRISSESFQTGSAEGRARLEGFLFNESHGPNGGLPYNGYEGNIWGQVVLDYRSDGNLYATTYAERVTDRDWTTVDELFWDEFDIPLSLDTDYILYIGFAGDLMIYGIDSADGTQHAMRAELIETPKYLPFAPYMAVISRQEATGEGLISAYFDDIRVSGEPLEKGGDINVDGDVDLKDAILGLQTLSGVNSNQSWSAGDIDGDGKVGLPEVIGTLNQLAIP